MSGFTPYSSSQKLDQLVKQASVEYGIDETVLKQLTVSQLRKILYMKEREEDLNNTIKAHRTVFRKITEVLSKACTQAYGSSEYSRLFNEAYDLAKANRGGE